eukprot:364789-Chlamydomonas_euryale.AAC.20
MSESHSLSSSPNPSCPSPTACPLVPDPYGRSPTAFPQPFTRTNRVPQLVVGASVGVHCRKDGVVRHLRVWAAAV